MRILFIGAHPDDCDVYGGGLALLHRKQGNAVKFISVTNGCCGHQAQDKTTLALRRKKETERVAERFGIEYDVWDIPDGECEATLENRKKMVREIRLYQPDLIITHRLCDYHPDHRNVSRLVCDASYLLIVPNFCPEAPALTKTPIIGYFYDNFDAPAFRPDVIVPVDAVMDEKFAMLDCHESQVYEWLPYTVGELDNVPKDARERLEWLRLPAYNREEIQKQLRYKMVYLNGECKFGMQAEKYRGLLAQRIGAERAQDIRYAECFEICEYGGTADGDRLKQLFFV